MLLISRDTQLIQIASLAAIYMPPSLFFLADNTILPSRLDLLLIFCIKSNQSKTLIVVIYLTINIDKEL